MADVLNRTTKEYWQSVNTPEYPPAAWLINPDLSAVRGQSVKYWKIDGDVVSLMDATEQAAVEAALNATRLQAVEDFLDDRGSAQGAYNTLLFKEINKLRVQNGDAAYTLAQLKAALRNEVV